ncbi:MAG: MBL fold metallo-hydrolase [Chloroflexi bacterium]|nr:MBL fold metallo-hydrolase [Chloroflexota bacterium]MCC6893578.1 MBL fold metallo-hydrolase [Anaerolineae bacterium]
MSIEIRILTMGLASTHCYILGDTDLKEAVVVDPVDQAPLILKTAQDAGWAIKLILATHAHFDHVLASKELKELTGAPFYIHGDSIPLLGNLPDTGIRFTGHPFPEAAVPDRLLTTESEIIEHGAIKFETLYTPGHAPGHIAFYMREAGLVISGDCLFAGSVGRTDLPGGDHDLLMRSIFEKLLPLGDDVKVLPGHMDLTTIGKERLTNPFILEYADLHAGNR